MEPVSIPFIPRYKRSHLNDEDVLQDIYHIGLQNSKRKVASFLEKESYIMENAFPSISECGFSILPYTLQIDGYLSVCAIKLIYSKDRVSSSEIATHLLQMLPNTVYYTFNTRDSNCLIRHLDKFLLFFCSYYSSFPDCLFGVIQINDPLIEHIEEERNHYWRRHFDSLTEEILHNCAKLDERYFMNDYLDLFSVDFCTNLIESAQETACRRLSRFIADKTIQWDCIPRKYRLFESKTRLFEKEYEFYLVRFFLERYSHPDQMIVFTDPISGNRISFPPCLVTPATSNQEFAKGSIMDRRLLSQRAPVTACFEGLLLDSLLLFDDRSATVDDLYSSLKLNPFINTSEDVSLSSAIKNVLWYYLSASPHASFSVILNQENHKYTLHISNSYVC